MLNSVYVGSSRIAGQGVFAATAFQAGDRVLIFDDSRIITPENPLRPEHGETEAHVDDLAGGVRVYMQEPERYINHCCDPNLYCKFIDGVRYGMARRAIAANEEITADYCVNSAVPGEHWQCGCGASRCRKVGGMDFFGLPHAF